MVTTAENYTNNRYRAAVGEGYDGVVRISINGYYGTGSLLYDGRAVLTAAHLFTEDLEVSPTVTFETTLGSQTLTASRVLINPSYDASSSSNDLAIVWLPATAPVTADRYNLYRSGHELGKPFEMAGYGLTGAGKVERTDTLPIRHVAWNNFDGLADGLPGISWRPAVGAQLIADFDNGSFQRDTLGQLINARGLGLGLYEGLIAPGDSGGPAFVEGLLAGVASYTLSYTGYDSNSILDSSFGEVAAWQRVSNYQQWIDQSLRAQYSNAPTKPSEVQTQVSEGDSGTHYAYFMVSLPGAGSTISSSQKSVDYVTRDGTAKAGQDYVAAEGTLILYPGETYAVIPVEVIGDRVSEPNEFFYLDISNPTGGQFHGGVLVLTAVRTIVNDDGIG